MTEQPHYTLPPDWLALIAQQEWEALQRLLTLVINAAMRAEREQHLGAAPYERSPDRRGYANGFKPKTVQTRLGELTFAVPQVRDGSFYPLAPEKGLRSERALRLALAEMYVHGVSTRKVSAVIEDCAVARSPPPRSVAPRPTWMPPWSPGAVGHWGSAATCCWTPATRRSAWTAW